MSDGMGTVHECDTAIAEIAVGAGPSGIGELKFFSESTTAAARLARRSSRRQ